MWLKRVEVNGFKSFCERIALEFTPGVCVVVGPNGCGKSNIVEAICWAMGEQGLRPLRAKSSEDLIFAGTQELAPAVFCEVTLVFDNQDGGAPVEFNQYAEIEVTRRLTREGESEYLINRARCRLKDITEFFLGTGLGKQAYSIIEQGEIERILQAKPEQIRDLIEEAAGVSKYRFRRDEAQRKIQATRENLTRIRDILSELERQLSSLNRQAKKAERYQQYQDELKQNELELFSYRASGIKKRTLELSSELELKHAELENNRTRLSSLELGLEDKRGQMELLQGSMRKEQQRNDQLKVQIKELDTEQKMILREEELERNADEKRRKELCLVEQLIAQLGKEIETKNEQKEKLGFELSSLGADLEAKLKEVESGQEELKKDKSESGSVQEEMSKVEQELARISERERNLVWQEARIKEELERIERRLVELEPEISGERQRSFNFNQSLHQLRKGFLDLEQLLAQEQAGIDRLKGGIAQRTGQYEEIKSQFQNVSAKLKSLREMIEKLEGFERGVKFILEKKRQGQEKNGIYGVVAELVETEPEYELALEAILGEKLQGVVVESTEQGLEAIQCLKEESAGRGTFIPLSLSGQREGVIPEHLRAQGVKALRELVRAKPGFEPVVNYLLGSSALVEDLEQAIGLWKMNNFYGAFVTKDGAVLDPYGVLTGGSKEQAGFLTKKRELKELEQEEENFKLKLNQAEQESAQLQSELIIKEGELEQLRNRKHNLQIEMLNQEKDLKQATDELNQKSDLRAGLKQRALELNTELERIRSSQAEIGRKKAELGSRMERFKEGLAQIIQEIELGERRLNSVKEERARILAEENRLREKLIGLEDAGIKIQKDRQEQIQKQQLLAQEIEQGKNNLARLTHQKEQMSEEQKKLILELEQQIKVQSELEEKINQLNYELEQAQAELKELNRLIREKEDAVRGLELDLERERLNLDNQKQLLWEFYQEDLDRVIEQYPVGAPGSEFQSEEKTARVDELRRLIHRMGEVNPTALEEYKEVEARWSFLSNQEADLISALEKLESTIQRINQEYRKQFKGTFENVNKIFQELFPKLFGGGKAMLVLAEEGNLLESGIEIIAQPHGKKQQHISLLSGGEKSLTALALVFALYLNRPSPFCLLDEVDAALDELNIDRFNQMIKKLVERSQIILITHNKRTMELADLLYGVTMEKPGVSKVVSVKLEEVDKHYNNYNQAQA